jgi:xylan 1,4-beta-xylosidase
MEPKKCPSPHHLSISRIVYEKNDAYTAYLKTGHPSQISPAQVAAYKAQATGAPDEERDVTVDDKGTWQANFPIREDDVILVKLKPAGVL